MPQPSNEISPRYYVFGVVILVLASLVICLQHLSFPFYYDEAVYVNLAQHPFHSDFYDDRIFFRHPPAHYLLLAAIGTFAGFSETAMRLPSVLFAAATVVTAYGLGVRLASRRAGLLSAIFLTFNVLSQQYAQSATMYAMFTFFLTLCLYGVLDENERVLALGFLGAIYTHYFGFYLAPALVLFYFRKFEGNWKKTAGRLALYALAYSPWLIIAMQGLVFHANRTSGLRWWSFHWLNALRQLSLPLFAAMLAFGFSQRRQEKLHPVLLVCGFFLVAAFFLIPFHRYLVPFVPILVVLGVAGLGRCIANFPLSFRRRHGAWHVAFAMSCACTLLIPNPEAYGIFPRAGKHLDLRDSIHTQEWNRVIATVPDSAAVATTNARSLLFYSNLQNLRHYQVLQFNENEKEFAALLERASHDWIVLPKYATYLSLRQTAERHPSYSRFAEFEHTLIYRKAPVR